MLTTEAVRLAKKEILAKLMEDLVKNYQGKDELPADIMLSSIRDDLEKVLGCKGLDISNLYVDLCPDESNVTVCIKGD